MVAGHRWGVVELARRQVLALEVGGSNPPAPTIDGTVAQLCQSAGLINRRSAVQVRPVPPFLLHFL